jgi:hypothetical protein
MTANERLAMIFAGILGRKLTDDEVLMFKYNVRLKLYDEKTGEVKKEAIVHNGIAQAGKNELLKVSSPKTVSQFAYMGIGSSNTAFNSSQTALGGELARSSAITPTYASGKITFQHTFAAGTGTGTVEEVGLFDASSSGNMLQRALTGTFVKGAGDALQMTIEIT